MPKWETTESVMLRGGPSDGIRLGDLPAGDLVAIITVPTVEDTLARYRKTNDCEQLRGAHTTEPFARLWYYDWMPER